MKHLITITILTTCTKLCAQFAPAAGIFGSTAIHGDSSCFVGWGISSQLNVGLRQINVADSGWAAVGNENSAVGKSRKNGVVSLGDGGSALLYFNPPIMDGPGFDFAVFENAFNDSFLELAHVEISENGVDFYRFPSVSLTQIDSQTASFGATFPENIHNLAGKYRMPYGTPFDISEILSPDLPMKFHYVKINDVVGSINPLLGTIDSKGNIINDPWPTNFASSGFDLDAIGVINQGIFNGLTSPEKEKMIIYNDQDKELTALQNLENIQIMASNGTIVGERNNLERGNKIDLSRLPEGIYIIRSQSTFQRISIQ
jgi:hypothetical protein